MKLVVNEACIGCGLCAGTCPTVFEMGEDGLAHAIADEVPAECEAEAIAAKDGCPVAAIESEA